MIPDLVVTATDSCSDSSSARLNPSPPLLLPLLLLMLLLQCMGLFVSAVLALTLGSKAPEMDTLGPRFDRTHPRLEFLVPRADRFWAL